MRIQSFPGSDGDHAEQHIGRRYGFLDKEAVDHFVDRTVSTDNDDLSEAVVDGFDRKLYRVVFVFGKDIFGDDVVVSQHFADCRPVSQPLTASRHRIDDCEPLVRDFHRRSGFKRSVAQGVEQELPETADRGDVDLFVRRVRVHDGRPERNHV